MQVETTSPSLSIIDQDKWKPVRQELKRRFIRMAPSQQSYVLNGFKSIAFAYYSIMLQTHERLIEQLRLSITMPTSGYYKRSVSDLELPTVKDRNGHFYVILKSKAQPCVFATGSSKLLYYAIRLPSTQFPQPKLLAWAKMHLGGTYDFSMAAVELQNEINARLHLEGDPRIPLIFQAFTYRSKENMQAGVLMELCEGNLLEKIQRNSVVVRLYPVKIQEEYWNIMEDFLGVLAKMEEKRLLHRDLKVDNIFHVRVNGQVRGRLADFGYLSYSDIQSDLNAGNLLHKAPEFFKKHLEFEGVSAAITKCQELLSECQDADDIDKCQHLGPETYVSKWSRDLEVYEQQLIEMEQKRDAIHQILNNTITEVWSAGMILFQVRCGIEPYYLILTKECVKRWRKNSSKIAAAFHKAMIALTQVDINYKLGHPAGVTSADQVTSLEKLNLFMLTVEPSQRPSAKLCLQLLQKLRTDGRSFT